VTPDAFLVDKVQRSLPSPFWPAV